MRAADASPSARGTDQSTRPSHACNDAILSLRIRARPARRWCIIDMQRDFIEPGGFGETLGNDVSLLEAIVPATQAVLEAWRAAGGLVVHTREAHQPDLSDCPPAKRNRGNPTLRIGDDGPMGRILVAGEPGNQIIDALAPVAGEIVIDKPGKGAFYATGLHETAAAARHHAPAVHAASPPRSACRPACAKPTTAATTACCWRTAPRATFPRSRRRRVEMIRAQGAIVGWTAPSAQLLAALGTH